MTEGVARAAGGLAEEHELRGFDAIHLASALLIRTASSGQGDEEAEGAVHFLGFDSNLTKAAKKVMRVYEPGETPDSRNQSDKG